MRAHHSFVLNSLIQSGRHWGGGGEFSDKTCEIADASVSFKSDVRKHFGFPVLRNDKREKVMDWKKKCMDTGRQLKK